MSKRTRKKQTQTANYLTLSIREQSPKVGSIVEHKNTIIVKKQEGDSVDVFYTDKNGKVVQAFSTPTVLDKGTILSLIKEHAKEVRAVLDAETATPFILKKNIDEEAIVHINGDRVVWQNEVEYRASDDAEVVFKSEDYPNAYITIGNEAIIGKNLPDYTATSEMKREMKREMKSYGIFLDLAYFEHLEQEKIYVVFDDSEFRRVINYTTDQQNITLEKEIAPNSLATIYKGVTELHLQPFGKDVEVIVKTARGKEIARVRRREHYLGGQKFSFPIPNGVYEIHLETAKI